MRCSTHHLLSCCSLPIMCFVTASIINGFSCIHFNSWTGVYIGWMQAWGYFSPSWWPSALVEIELLRTAFFFLDQVNKLTDVRSKDLSHTFNHLPRLLKIYLINPFSLICLSFLYPPTNLSSLFQLYFIQLLSEFFVNMWWLLSCVVLHWWYLNFRNSTYDNRKTLTMQLWADWDSTFYRVYSEF